jgi:putative protein-disulfide isomerase
MFKSLFLITPTITASVMAIILNCNAQTKMTQKSNPLLCDPETGICELPDTLNAEETTLQSINKSIKIIYFTDPICSSCWGIEPQLRKLKLEYGGSVEIEYRMGGLLPDWSYNSGGISKPSDVAHHWDEVSVYYDMPIDGDVWLEDPLASSYPPSIAFKAAQIQSQEKAIEFLRVLREQVFMQKKNITRWEIMESAAQQVGLNTIQLRSDFEGAAKQKFEEDLQLARKMGVRGFPTLFISNQNNQQEIVYGSKPYESYEAAIKKLAPTVEKYPYNQDWINLFDKYPTLTAKEYAILTTIERNAAEKQLYELAASGKLTQYSCKNGSIWKRK